MTGEDCVSRIKTVLETDTTLKTYIRKVYLGVRQNIPDPSFPCIIVEPSTEAEEEMVYPCQRVTMSVIVSAYMRDYNTDRQIVGDTNNKGIMDIKRDILKALATDPTLDGNCLRFRFPSTAYDITAYPTRGMSINMEVLYETTFTTRS